jgi:hypothetical protein
VQQIEAAQAELKAKKANLIGLLKDDSGIPKEIGKY